MAINLKIFLHTHTPKSQYQSLKLAHKHVRESLPKKKRYCGIYHYTSARYGKPTCTYTWVTDTHTHTKLTRAHDVPSKKIKMQQPSQSIDSPMSDDMAGNGFGEFWSNPGIPRRDLRLGPTMRVASRAAGPQEAPGPRVWSVCCFDDVSVVFYEERARDGSRTGGEFWIMTKQIFWYRSIVGSMRSSDYGMRII